MRDLNTLRKIVLDEMSNMFEEIFDQASETATALLNKKDSAKEQVNKLQQRFKELLVKRGLSDEEIELLMKNEKSWIKDANEILHKKCFEALRKTEGE